MAKRNMSKMGATKCEQRESKTMPAPTPFFVEDPYLCLEKLDIVARGRARLERGSKGGRPTGCSSTPLCNCRWYRLLLDRFGTHNVVLGR
jgi:hypothetical protein